MNRRLINFQNDVLLAEHTTIGLGGKAKYFLSCKSLEEIRSSLTYARDNNLRVHVLAGGSNVIFSDKGFDGLVLKIDLRGIAMNDEGEWVTAVVAAGENWDDFVKLCIGHHCGGIECLSGIPGSVGATPIQNVGAYGQEVSDTIVSLKALDRERLDIVEFPAAECRFEYRRSRFKSIDRDRYIITEVTFRLRKFARSEVRYPELDKFIKSRVDLTSLADGRPFLEAVRSAVIALRRTKSMVIDPADPNTRSVGSFFMNPILTSDEFAKLEYQWKRAGYGHNDSIPTFPAQDRVKVPAAWLVEKAGFQKGYRKGGVGVSANHTLALINCGGTSKELVELANEIEEKVYERFGVLLEREPVVVM